MATIISDKRTPFLLSKTILGYDICEVDIPDINLLNNIIEEIICVGSTIYTNLDEIYARLFSICYQLNDTQCINYLNSLNGKIKKWQGIKVYCLPHPSGANAGTRKRLDMGKIIYGLRKNIQAILPQF